MARSNIETTENQLNICDERILSIKAKIGNPEIDEKTKAEYSIVLDRWIEKRAMYLDQYNAIVNADDSLSR